jgi:hypothetical protein
MAKRYQDTYRRTLLDMHIPDWDSAFLSSYDPHTLAESYERAGVDGVLIYCKSHLGLSYWPSPVGGIHPVAAQRDLVGELLAEVRQRDMGAAAYHSVIFDNWAAEAHPEWRVVSSGTLLGEPNVTALGRRYGTLCPNNPEYREFERRQIVGLLERYEFDALWVDMVFWTAVCVCQCCRERLMTEEDLDIPTQVDWADADWCRFAAARERWLDEFWQTLRGAALEARPEIAVTHNIGTAFGSWYSASTTWQSARDSFTGGDLYGGRDEQLFVSKLMNRLSQGRPAEYMTSRSPDLRYHVQLRSERELLVHALGATVNHLAFLVIDAVDPVGTIEPGVYDRIGRVFERTAPYELALGGRPVEEVAVYFGDNAKMSWAENGKHISERPDSERPHSKAVFGACRALQEAHIPFGVLTRAGLDRLSEFRVLVLPDVIRMDADEVEAVRHFVRRGGQLYASGQTSQGDLSGGRGDFALGDVLGVRAEEPYAGGIIFLRPMVEIAAAVEPERYVSWGLAANADGREMAPVRALDLRFAALADSSARPLATVTLPYGFPSSGSLEEHGFASIHSSPPWTDTDRPAIVDHPFGTGRAVYSLAPIETGTDHASRRLFTALIADLLGAEVRLAATGPHEVWVTLFDQLDRDRTVLSVLNYELQDGMTADVAVRVAPPEGYRIVAVRDAVTGEEQLFDLRDGRAEGLLRVDLFAQLLLELEATSSTT